MGVSGSKLRVDEGNTTRLRTESPTSALHGRRLYNHAMGHGTTELEVSRGVPHASADRTDNASLENPTNHPPDAPLALLTSHISPNILRGHTAMITAASISRDRTQVVSVSHDCTGRIWDLRSGNCLQILRGHDASLWSVAFSPNQKWVATASSDQTAKIWDVRSGTCMQTLVGHSDAVLSVVISEDQTLVVTGSRDYTCKVFLAENGECLYTLGRHTSWVRSVAISKDGSFIVTASYDHTCNVFDVEDGDFVRVLQGHSEGVVDVVISDDQSWILSTSLDATCRLYNEDGLSTQAFKQGRFCEKNAPILGISRHSSAGGARVWVALESTRSRTGAYTVEVHDMENEEVLATLHDPADVVMGVAMGDAYDLIATANMNDYSLHMQKLDR